MKTHFAIITLQAQIKAWRGKFFVFMTDRRVPATNNGFRSDWEARVHAGYRSITSTARLQAHTAIDAVRNLVASAENIPNPISQPNT